MSLLEGRCEAYRRVGWDSGARKTVPGTGAEALNKLLHTLPGQRSLVVIQNASSSVELQSEVAK